MKPVQLFCWHFMAYPYLDKDFDENEYSGWVTVPNTLWDNRKAPRALSGVHRPARLCRRARLRRHGAQRASSEHLRLDAVAEHDRGGAHPMHHARQDRRARQSAAAASAIRCAWPRNTPCSINMSDGRLIAGFAPGGGPETFNYDVPSANTRETILGSGGFDRPLLDRRRPVRSRGALLSACAT